MMDENQKIMVKQLAEDVTQSFFESYYGHAGRPGEVGGSAPSGAGGGRKRITPQQASHMIQTSRGMSKRKFDMLWKRSREGGIIPVQAGWK
jgi:hypothetical protein